MSTVLERIGSKYRTHVCVEKCLCGTFHFYAAFKPKSKPVSEDEIYLEDLLRNSSVLKQFSSNPCKQYWLLNEKTNTFEYLGEFNNRKLAEAVEKERNEGHEGKPFHLIDAAVAASILISTQQLDCLLRGEEKKEVYEIIIGTFNIGTFNRGFGEAPHGKVEVEVGGVEEAQRKAQEYLEKNGTPDDYIVEVRLKK